MSDKLPHAQDRDVNDRTAARPQHPTSTLHPPRAALDATAGGNLDTTDRVELPEPGLLERARAAWRRRQLEQLQVIAGYWPGSPPAPHTLARWRARQRRVYTALALGGGLAGFLVGLGADEQLLEALQ